MQIQPYFTNLTPSNPPIYITNANSHHLPTSIFKDFQKAAQTQWNYRRYTPKRSSPQKLSTISAEFS